MIARNIRYWPTALGMVTLVGVSPAALAVTKTVALDRVSNNEVVCEGSELQNCLLTTMPKVSCPAGQDPISVSVSVGPGEMETCVAAINDAEFSSCYNIVSVTHQTLSLLVAKDAPGEVELNGEINNTDGSGDENIVCNDSFPETKFTFRRAAGESIEECSILESTKPALATVTYTPEDPEWATFYGAGTVDLQFAANADANVIESGTWSGGIRTGASARVTVTPLCEEIPEEAPAIGALGTGALAIALGGLGALVGFRRRG